MRWPQRVKPDSLRPMAQAAHYPSLAHPAGRHEPPGSRYHSLRLVSHVTAPSKTGIRALPALRKNAMPLKADGGRKTRLDLAFEPFLAPPMQPGVGSLLGDEPLTLESDARLRANCKSF